MMGKVCMRTPGRSTCSPRRTRRSAMRLWEARRLLSLGDARDGALQDLGGRRRPARPRSRRCSTRSTAISAATGVRMLTYGHAGDGNLHVNLLWNDPDLVPRWTTALVAPVPRGDRRCAARSAASTASGRRRRTSSRSSRRRSSSRSQRRSRRVFDPKGLLNPHKIFPRRTLEAAERGERDGRRAPGFPTHVVAPSHGAC